MDILGYLLDALTPFNLMLALVGVVLGTVIGALPGLSATMAVAVLVPFTFTMDPAAGLIALGAIYTGAIYGGAFAAILVNTPGTPSAIATTFDGFPMAKRGDGGLAISLATIASVSGGIIGALALLMLAPPLAKVALAFGPTEYFWLAVFGLTLIAALSVGNTIKGLIGACIGLFLSMVGVAVVGGDVRYTMGMQRFLSGIDLTSAIIGLYCVPVILDLVATADPHLKPSATGGLRLMEGTRKAIASKFNILRSSIIGTVIGILPGAGGSIAGLVSYSEARRSSGEPESFGKGNPEGVIATEAANNATVGGGFIPTLVLGIPGTPPDAIILGALLVQGIKIGPTLFTTDAPVVYTFIWGLLIATVLMLPVGLLIGRYAYNSIIKVPKSVLAPTVALLTIIGSFAIHSNVEDSQLMVALGILAWILNRYGFQPSPIVLGLVLGSIAEQGFVQTWLIGNASGRIPEMFFGRPISIGIICVALLTLLFPIWSEWKAKRRRQLEVAGAVVEDAGAGIEPEGKTRNLPSMVIAALLIALGVWTYTAAGSMSPLGSVFPKTISVALMVFSAMLIVQHIRRPAGPASTNPAFDSGTRRRTALGAVMMAWVIAMPEIGFLATSLVAFGLIMAIADYDRPAVRVWLIWSVAGIAICTGFWWLMANVLLLRMPAGLLF
ncbi:C4-dicarboxylate ABC transporter permease [Labrenzia sp. CP4]|jgi:putative tricarboxylic transport membrane protein|uniref:tripartite tricarboxylate transporter permease n=1 Tax=Labrenzia sp. CP4 TaxID=1674922 RepID=UPI000782A8DF|nr:tripartite tricarboxylate transporter permease [Labrenzia sp. CP4]AMN52421.1 C4-dicarboxylate ABC transporter permease [Labrenzia sp. CP4]